MSSCRRRVPLFDLSNLATRADLSPPPSQTASARPPSPQKPFKSAPTNAARDLQLTAPPASRAELSSDGGGHATAATPPTPAPTAMDVDACTPRATETERLPPCSSKGESYIIYSRRKSSAPSHLISSCPPPGHHLKPREFLEDRGRRKAVKRGFSAAMLGEEGVKGVPSSSRRHSLPTMQKRQWLPEDFVAAQRSHFAEVDAFQLSEEEGDLSEE